MTNKLKVTVYGEGVPFANGSTYEDTCIDLKDNENYLVLIFENSRRSISHQVISGYSEEVY